MTGEWWKRLGKIANSEQGRQKRDGVGRDFERVWICCACWGIKAEGTEQIVRRCQTDVGRSWCACRMWMGCECQLIHHQSTPLIWSATLKQLGHFQSLLLLSRTWQHTRAHKHACLNTHWLTVNNRTHAVDMHMTLHVSELFLSRAV